METTHNKELSRCRGRTRDMRYPSHTPHGFFWGPLAPASSQISKSASCPDTSQSTRSICPAHCKGGPYKASASSSPGQQRWGDGSERLLASHGVLDDFTGKGEKARATASSLFWGRMHFLSLPRHDCDTVPLPSVYSPSFISKSLCEARLVLRSPLPYTGGLFVFVFIPPHASYPVRISRDSRVGGLKGFCEQGEVLREGEIQLQPKTCSLNSGQRW